MAINNFDGTTTVRPGPDWSKERRLLWKLVNEEGTKISDIALTIGMSRSAVSRYVNNDYPDSEQITAAVREYLKKIGRWEDAPAEVETATAAEPAEPAMDYMKSIRELTFVMTRDAERVMGLCRMCHQNREFGLLTGNPGTGKTHTLELYQRQNQYDVALITCDETSTVKSVLVDTAEALGVSPIGSRPTLLSRIVRELRKNPRLLVYDEADLAKGPAVLETIRAIYDKSKTIGVVLCGNNSLAERILLYAEDRPEMARLRDRIGYYCQLNGISVDEAYSFLVRVNATAEAKKMLAAIGRKRGIRQLVKALGRLLEVTEGRVIDEGLVRELGDIVLSFNA